MDESQRDAELLTGGSGSNSIGEAGLLSKTMHKKAHTVLTLNKALKAYMTLQSRDIHPSSEFSFLEQSLCLPPKTTPRALQSTLPCRVTTAKTLLLLAPRSMAPRQYSQENCFSTCCAVTDMPGLRPGRVCGSSKAATVGMDMVCSRKAGRQDRPGSFSRYRGSTIRAECLRLEVARRGISSRKIIGNGCSRHS